MRTLLTRSIITTTLLVTACAGDYANTKSTASESSYANRAVVSNNQFIQNNYEAADSLIKQLGNQIKPSSPIIVATMVNIDDLNSSSTFGRLVSEQVSARFSQAKLTMLEMKLRGYVYMTEKQGELLLTREIKDVALTHNAQAVIVGTYAISQDTIFVNLKVIQPNTNIVLAVHDYTFPNDPSMKAMARSPTRY